MKILPENAKELLSILGVVVFLFALAVAASIEGLLQGMPVSG